MTSDVRGQPSATGSQPSVQGEPNEPEPGAETERSSQEPEADAEEEPVPHGAIFDILRNERRRRVLAYLDEQDGYATLGEMAERLAAIENGKPESQITSQERKRLYVGLYQCHLPRMDDAGAIEFNDDRGVVEANSHTESFLEHLPDDDAAGRDSQWPLGYLAISVLGAGLLGLDAAGVLGAAIRVQLLFGGVVAAVGVCAAIHWYSIASGTDAD